MNDFILVKPEPRKEKTDSGLYLAESAQDPCDRGDIVECGPDVEYNYTKGQKILFPRHVGTIVRIDGEDLMVLHEESVYGVIR
jgi:chaperonin GroES